MAAIAPPSAADESRSPQFEQDLLEKSQRNLLCFRYILRLFRFMGLTMRQSDKRFECVSCFLGQHDSQICAGVPLRRVRL
jgi:hypothetical protein